MAKIQKTTEEERQAIIRRSVLQLADRPSEHGQKPSDIKNAIAMPVFGSVHSVLAELDRVVDEINAALEGTSDPAPTLATLAQTLIGAINELRSKLTSAEAGSYTELQTNAQTVLEAINELRSKLTSADPGAYSSLPTTAQTALEAIAELDNVKATKEALTTAVSDLESSIVGMGTSQQLYTDEAEASAKRYTDEEVQTGVGQANSYADGLYNTLNGKKVDKTAYNANKGLTDHRLDSLENDVSTLKTSTIHICGYGEYNPETKVPTIQNPNPHVLYLVPGGVSTQTGGNLYTEFRWVSGDSDFWERIGTAEFDLTNYYTKPEIETLLNSTRHICTSSEVDASGTPILANPNAYTTYLVPMTGSNSENYYAEWIWIPPIGTSNSRWEIVGMIPKELLHYVRNDVTAIFYEDVVVSGSLSVYGQIFNDNNIPYLNESDSATLSEMDEIFAVLS